jgi:hypothetical protein
MKLTFTLQTAYTGATYVAGPFNISGTTSSGTTYWLATGVTKSQLTTGYEINTTYETLTGGTIASTGTCTTTRSWQITEPTPQTVDLQVYGVDEDSSPANISLYYTINGGVAEYFPTSPFSASCGLYGTIGGLQLNDVVVFGNDQTYPLSGVGSSSCPPLSGTNTTYTHTIGISAGNDYVAFATNKTPLL